MSVDTSELQGSLQTLVSEAAADARAYFPSQAKVISQLAQAAQRRWLEYASGQRELPNGKRMHSVTGSYLSSIKIEEDGEMRYVIYSDDPKATWIEQGFPAFDMKKMLNTSKKVKKTKDGRRYMTVPFRTQADDAHLGVILPKEAAAWWLRPQRRSTVLGPPQEGSQTTQLKWGDRLTRAELTGIGIDPDSKMGSRLVGMVRMDRPNGSEVVTFRTMVEGSSGWIMPARDGQYPAQATADWVQAEYASMMQAALEADTRELGGEVSR